MTDQTLNVEVAQDRRPPLIVRQCAEQGMQRIGSSPKTFCGRDFGDLRDRRSGLACMSRSGQNAFA